MSDSSETANFDAVAEGRAEPVTPSATGSWYPEAGSQATSTAAEHPELLVGAAFLGGVILATILKRLAG